MHRSDPSVRVRRLRSDEGHVLRDLRLRSLRDAPAAFGQTVEDAAAQPDAEWSAAARASSEGERRAWFVAERAETTGPAWAPGRADAKHSVVGIVLGRRRPPDTLLIFSMWVDPTARRAGIGRSLITTLEVWAGRWGATRSVLWVFPSNEPAIRFYRRLGYDFEVNGEDARTGARYGAFAMVRVIRPRRP